MKFYRENIKIANMLKFFASPEKLAFWRYALLILRRRYSKRSGFEMLFDNLLEFHKYAQKPASNE